MRLLLSSLLVLAFAPAAAEAATVRVVPPAPCTGPQFEGRFGSPCPSPTVLLSAAPGEANDVTATQMGPESTLVRDEGAPLEAGTGCERVDDHTAACPNLSLDAALGDRDDQIDGAGSASGGEGNDVLDDVFAADGGPGNDSITGANSASGGDGDDVLDDVFGADGGPGNDVMNANVGDGGPGNDVLSVRDNGDGGPGQDLVDCRSGSGCTLLGGSDADLIIGGPADDTVGGGAGDDRLDGGGGLDRLSYVENTAGVRVDLSGPTQVFSAPGEQDSIANFESVDGGSGDDVLVTAGGVGTPIRDPLQGGAGDDDITVRSPMSVEGGAGDDRINGTPGEGNLFDGGPGDDRLTGEGAADELQGGLGRDVLRGRGGADRLVGRGPERGRGRPAGGPDRLLGGAGADRLDGSDGRDRLVGGAGRDALIGRGGADVLLGGAGMDRLDGRERSFEPEGRDRADCGADRRDRALVDRRDRVAGCERIERPRRARR